MSPRKLFNGGKYITFLKKKRKKMQKIFIYKIFFLPLKMN